MGYTVKWVEDHLGISRKALRNFEEKGLMPKNQNGETREYDEVDLQRIWAIRIMQGMGYSVREIASIVKNPDTELQDTIGDKIRELENEKEKIERHIGYAKTIKLTGRFPSFPKEMGTIKFDDFYEKSLDKWNFDNDPETKKYLELAEVYRNMSEDEWNDSDLGKMLAHLEEIAQSDIHMDTFLTETMYPREILKRRKLGAEHPDVQFIVKLMYEGMLEVSHHLDKIPKDYFMKYLATTYLCGDVAIMKEERFGKDGCKFIADAIAIHGGFRDSDDPRLS